MNCFNSKTGPKEIPRTLKITEIDNIFVWTHVPDLAQILLLIFYASRKIKKIYIFKKKFNFLDHTGWNIVTSLIFQQSGLQSKIWIKFYLFKTIILLGSSPSELNSLIFIQNFWNHQLAIKLSKINNKNRFYRHTSRTQITHTTQILIKISSILIPAPAG